MKSTFVLAQTAHNGDKAFNLVRAGKLIAEAVDRYHPQAIVFPEMYSSHYPLKTERETVLAAGEPLDGPFVTGMQQLAKANGVWLIFGIRESVPDPDDDRNYNTICVVDDQGTLVSTYHKTHLYDAFGFAESQNARSALEDLPEGAPVTDAYFQPLDTPFGKLGIFVCYELRYPEVARYLVKQGAEVLVMPAAWVKGPKKSEQFRTLIQARAIENAAYVLACDMCGEDCIGESVAVDPTGAVLAAAGVDEALICVTIDTDSEKTTREAVPSCKGV